MPPRNLKRAYCGTPSPRVPVRSQYKGIRHIRTHEANKTPSLQVKLNDLISDMHSTITKLEADITGMKEKLAMIDPILNAVKVLNYSSKDHSGIPCEDVKIVEKIVNHVAAEAREQIRRSKNAIVFNVADKPKLSTIASAILNASGLGPVACTFMRLKKLNPKRSCPVLFQFADEKTASTFVNSQSIVNRQPQFSKLRIGRDLTPLQRRYKRPNLITATASKAALSQDALTQDTYIVTVPTPEQSISREEQPTSSVEYIPITSSLTGSNNTARQGNISFPSLLKQVSTKLPSASSSPIVHQTGSQVRTPNLWRSTMNLVNRRRKQRSLPLKP